MVDLDQETSLTSVRVIDGRLVELGAAMDALADDVVFSHRTAGFLWGLWLPGFDGIEITIPAGDRGSRYTTSVQRQPVVAHRRRTAPDHTTTRFGLPVTSLARTWVDLAPLLDLPDLVAAGDSALRAGCRRVSLDALIADAARTRGIRKARIAVDLLDERSRSRPESRIRTALVRANLPWPRVNEPIFDAHGGWLAEPDLHYPEAKLALEYNGADHAGIQRMRKDATRLLDLQRDGWDVRTYTAPDAFARLDDVVADVRSLLRLRAPELLLAARHRVTDSQDQRRPKSRL